MTKQREVNINTRPDVRTVAREAASPVSPESMSAPDLLTVDRRRFLEASGFALFLSALAGCSRAPVRHILSAASGEEGSIVGLARHYASTCGGCAAACGVLVKTRDGRPIKLEGNPDHPLSRGGLCAVGQAEVLGLYDSQRLREPKLDGDSADWQAVDRRVREQLTAAKQAGRRVVLLTGTVHSPATRAASERFLAAHAGSQHIAYDPLSASAIASAHQQTHNLRAVPRYRFERADVIVSLNADFLGTWITPVEYTAAYREGRVPQGDAPQMSYHLQIESRVSLTGCNADERWVVPPETAGAMAVRLADALARRAGRDLEQKLPDVPVEEAKIAALVERLWQARGRALVVCDSQDVTTQIACNMINDLLGSYGKTVEITPASQQRLGDESQVGDLVDKLHRGEIGVLVIAGVNPVYDLPIGGELAELLGGENAPFVVRLAQHADETANVAACVCPESHWLEAWGDAEPVVGVASLSQPTIAALGSTRTLLECLLAWTGRDDQAAESAYAAVKRHWQTSIFPERQQQELDAGSFWEQALRQGAIELQRSEESPPAFQADAAVMASLSDLESQDKASFALQLYPKVGLLDGRPAHNPWLQELPDPISKAVWDNYACLSPLAAQRLGVVPGDLVRVAAGDVSIELPVLIQVGQHDRVVAVALGYGRMGTDRFAKIGPQWIESRSTVGPSGLIGENAATLLRMESGFVHYHRPQVQVTKTPGHRPLATTQQHHSLSVPEHLASPGTERRPIVEQTTLDAYRENTHAGAVHHHDFAGELWPDDHPYSGHRWGMVIDLNKCTGCSACVIACQAENNVPVVGRDEVRRHREMHWIRIDRYFADDQSGGAAVHQPMLCHHCANAPCENVCPVLATVHSEEGLNQQVYNRCVGTRYCANNCPYKVRRFNWFEYSQSARLENAALNPDITVRSRGVMEKCSFCVQRIQETTLRARQRGEAVPDGAVQTACQQSCPAAAIAFGDLNDKESNVAKLVSDGRFYQVLAELNVRPSVGYLRVVHNRQTEERESHHG